MISAPLQHGQSCIYTLFPQGQFCNFIMLVDHMLHMHCTFRSFVYNSTVTKVDSANMQHFSDTYLTYMVHALTGCKKKKKNN